VRPGRIFGFDRVREARGSRTCDRYSEYGITRNCHSTVRRKGPWCEFDTAVAKNSALERDRSPQPDRTSADGQNDSTVLIVRAWLHSSK
jgi:hypothetical protein